MAASALAALSCTKEVNDQTAPEKEQVTMSFDATIGAPTKVEIGSSATEDGVTTHKLNWSVGDKIKVYANDASNNEGVEFTTDITTPSATATFTGTIDADDTYYAFYPSSAGAKWYKSSSNFGFTIPASQKPNGIASGFAIAQADNNGLLFEHVTGFVKFTIPDEYDGKIAGVTFAGNSEEVLAGYVKVFPNDASQNEFSYDNSKYTEVNLLPASGGAFSAGTYYIAVYPTEFEQGITMTFTNTDGATAIKTSDKSAEIVAGGILNVKTITGLSFVSAKAQELPWNEEFSGDDVLSNYVTTGTVSVAANDNYATGTMPELYLNGTASFSANIDVKNASRNLTLTYKTNKSSLILSASEGVTPKKQTTGDEKTYLYHITLADNVEQMVLTWTSSVNSRLDDIMLVEGTISFQTLTFDKTSVAATIGEDFTEPVLSGAKTTVSYSSSDPSVATVNATTGEVSLVSDGETVITATAVGTSQYYEAAASYTLTVSPAPTGNEKYYVKVTSAPTDWSGTYLIVVEHDVNKALSGISTTNTKYGQGESVIINSGKIEAKPELVGYEVIISKASDGQGYKFSFKSSLLSWSSGNSLTVAATESNNSRWTISLESGKLYVYNCKDTARQLLWNKNSPRFACYTGKESDGAYYYPNLYKKDI